MRGRVVASLTEPKQYENYKNCAGLGFGINHSLINKNITINYLYRDAGNFKLYGSKVFSNNEGLPLRVIRQNIGSKLIDGLYFVPETWGIERLKFDKFDAMEDHSWH